MAKLYADNACVEEIVTSTDVIVGKYYYTDTTKLFGMLSPFSIRNGQIGIEKPTLYICEYCGSVFEHPGTCRHCGAPVLKKV